MTRKNFIAGNWKMNNTIGEAVVLAQEISNHFYRDWTDKVDVAVCPPYVDLKPVRTVFDFDKVKISVGAQNVYWEPKGAFTGEISIPMLREIGCAYCIVGHSERRTLFGETNEEVNKKTRALLEARINPIVCVGESLAVRDEGTYLEFVTAQVRAAFAGIDAFEVKGAVVAYEPVWAIGTGRTATPEQAQEVLEFVTAQVRAAFAGIDAFEVKGAVVAYEPVWAIGTGRTATPEQAQEVCSAIRATLGELFGEDVADQMRVLYGGSMNEGNAELLLAEPDIDGGLIGGAALKAKSFVEIVKAAMA